MKIVKNRTEFNEEFMRCIKNKEPFVVLLKFKKYSNINYDVWNVNYNLNAEAVEKINTIFDKIADDISDITGQKTFWWTIGPTVGSMWKIPIDIAEKYLPKINEIVMDEKNWVSLNKDKKDQISGLMKLKITAIKNE